MMGDNGARDIIFLEMFFLSRKTRYGGRRNVWSLLQKLSFIFFQKTINFFFKFFKNIRMI